MTHIKGLANGVKSKFENNDKYGGILGIGNEHFERILFSKI